MKFRKKPVVIEAIRYTGVNERLMSEYEQFVGRPIEVRNLDNVLRLVIPMLEGEHIATPGDWIIKGVKGEFYPCKPDVFAESYEAADDA